MQAENVAISFRRVLGALEVKKKTLIHPFFDTRDADGELNTNKVTIKTRAPTLALARFTCILLTENAVNFS